MPRLLEEVFVTEGVPQETFVEPPNYGAILVDIRHPGKPVIVEGQSGTGKTTTIRKIVERLGLGLIPNYLSARKPVDVHRIAQLAESPQNGLFIIDDFHRLAEQEQTRLAEIAKVAAEEASSQPLPKLVLIGINQLGSSLIQFGPDIAKRCGIHRILPGDEARTLALVEQGCETLNIQFSAPQLIFEESRGDYWLTQLLAQMACSSADVFEEQADTRMINLDRDSLRQAIVEKLQAAYHPAVKEFCRGRRFRPSNDPYFKLLRVVAENGSSNADLTMLANQRDDVRQSINNVKDRRLTILLDSKPLAARYFFYNAETKQFSIDDPAAFYYVRHLDWDALRAECGFKEASGREYEFDVALSFAGENRELARYVADQLESLDVRVFYDKSFEINFLGGVWSAQFERIFQRDSRYVVCLLDSHHREKIWPTFERECFAPRVPDAEVLPIYLDDTVFPGIPKDLVGIKFPEYRVGGAWQSAADTKVIFPILDRIG
jgi:hypothetical protein